MQKKLRLWAKFVGYSLLLASMILSYKGFEFNFTAADGAWSLVFIVIGILLTCAVTIIQLVFNTAYEDLNLTLKVAGVLSYVYSIYTNYRGLQPFMAIDGNDYTVWIVAIFLDAVPEPLIAWSMGESLRGDLLGNIQKWVGLDESKPKQPIKIENKKYQPKHRPDRNPDIFRPNSKEGDGFDRFH